MTSNFTRKAVVTECSFFLVTDWY